MTSPKTFVVALVCLSATLAACGRSEPQPETGSATAAQAGRPAEVVVYTARKYQLVEELFDEYSRTKGVKITAVTDDAGPLIQKLKAEGSSSPADVLITVDAGDLWFAAREGLLQSIDSAVLDANVPGNLRDPEGRWYGLAVRARTVAYSTKAFPDGPTVRTYADLAGPEWKGKLCLRSSKHVYNRSLVAALIARHGEAEAEKIVKGWVANLATDPFSSDTLLLEAIVAGQCTVGVSNHYYLGRMIAEKGPQPVALLWPDQQGAGVHVNVSGAGVTAHADQREAAVALLEWLSTPEVQARFAGANQEYPANPAAQPTEIVRGFGTYAADPISVAKVGELQPVAARLMDRTGWK
jgi:iron(III) transport system substrate-binding protein